MKNNKKVMCEKLNKAERFVKGVVLENASDDKDRLWIKVVRAIDEKLGHDKLGTVPPMPPEYRAAMVKFGIS
jgi:hypothetical protein